METNYVIIINTNAIPIVQSAMTQTDFERIGYMFLYGMALAAPMAILLIGVWSVVKIIRHPRFPWGSN